jgi:hypothetical protein
LGEKEGTPGQISGWTSAEESQARWFGPGRLVPDRQLIGLIAFLSPTQKKRRATLARNPAFVLHLNCQPVSRTSPFRHLFLRRRANI